MVFERVGKSVFKGRSGLKEMEVYVGTSGFSFNRYLVQGIDYLEVYLDKEENMMGFKKGNNLTGFRVQESGKKNISNKRISVNRSIMGQVSRGIFISKFEGDMFIIKGVEFINKSPRKEYPSVVRDNKHKEDCSCFDCSIDTNAVKAREELDKSVTAQNTRIPGKIDVLQEENTAQSESTDDLIKKEIDKDYDN